MVSPRYVQNPLLLDGKKFDVRSYLLIACAMPYMVFFGHGYARLTLSLYDPHSSDLSGHLTNQVRTPYRRSPFPIGVDELREIPSLLKNAEEGSSYRLPAQASKWPSSLCLPFTPTETQVSYRSTLEPESLDQLPLVC